MEEILTMILGKAHMVLSVMALAATCRIGWEIGAPIARRISRWIYD